MCCEHVSEVIPNRVCMDKPESFVGKDLYWPKHSQRRSKNQGRLYKLRHTQKDFQGRTEKSKASRISELRWVINEPKSEKSGRQREEEEEEEGGQEAMLKTRTRSYSIDNILSRNNKTMRLCRCFLDTWQYICKQRPSTKHKILLSTSFVGCARQNRNKSRHGKKASKNTSDVALNVWKTGPFFFESVVLVGLQFFDTLLDPDCFLWKETEPKQKKHFESTDQKSFQAQNYSTVCKSTQHLFWTFSNKTLGQPHPDNRIAIRKEPICFWETVVSNQHEIVQFILDR